VKSKALTSFDCFFLFYGVGLDLCIEIVYQRFLKFEDNLRNEMSVYSFGSVNYSSLLIQAVQC